MGEPTTELHTLGPDITFEAFGVRISVTANRAEALERLPGLLPPGWRPCGLEEAEHRLGILGNDRGTYDIYISDTLLLGEVDLELALLIIDGAVRARVALQAPDRIFVHAGVVAHGDRAILIPGRSFTGKTTLVAELVRAGATYFSDEFAALDEAGFVHPYPKPLSLRDETKRQVDHAVETLGGVSGDRAVPVGLVVVTTYRPDAHWDPKPLLPGQAVLALMSNTIPARERPQQTLRSIARAVEDATLLESERGDAAELVPRLLAELEGRSG